MSNPNPRTDHLKPYQVVANDVQLAEKPLAVRVSAEVDTVIRALPNKAEWMRRVLTEAAEKELLKQKSKT
jgi:hypothetical protein